MRLLADAVAAVGGAEPILPAADLGRAVGPSISPRKRRIRHTKRRYRERWRIAATFNRLNDVRRIATRYDKLARNYALALALAAVVTLWG